MRRHTIRYAVVAALAAMTLAACSSSSKSGSSTTTTPSSTGAASTTTAAPTPTSGGTPTSSGTTTAKPTVATASTTLGTVLVDSKGMPLYTSSGDTTPGVSSCTGGCATIWPPASVTGTPTYASSLTASKFSVITRSDGSKQLAFNGKPLYTFASDSAGGAPTGQGVGGFSVAMAG